MGRHDFSVSEKFKMQIASELGLTERIQTQGWDSLTSREIGLIVKKMIEKGEEGLISNL